MQAKLALQLQAGLGQEKKRVCDARRFIVLSISNSRMGSSMFREDVSPTLIGFDRHSLKPKMEAVQVGRMGH